MRDERGLLAGTRWIEHQEAIDPVVRSVEAVTAGLGRGRLREVLGGQWLGHSLHPLLTDIPLGCWTSAILLDFVGGRRSRSASQRLVALGVLTALPTAAAGVSDWLQIERPSQRVGIAHATSNGTALVLFSLSYLARRRDRQLSGVTLGVFAGLAATLGGFLGGHLTLTSSVTRENRLLDDTQEDD